MLPNLLYLYPGPPRGFGGLGTKPRNEPPCERSEQIRWPSSMIQLVKNPTSTLTHLVKVYKYALVVYKDFLHSLSNSVQPCLTHPIKCWYFFKKLYWVIWSIFRVTKNASFTFKYVFLTAKF